MSHELLTARLVRTVQLSEDTKHLEFTVAERPRFDFIPGQFVSMKAWRDGQEITRAYSIASAPRGDGFDVCLNRVPEGFFSNYLCDLEDGAEVKFHGPHGYFTLREPPADTTFIATGTGIAPMRAMLQWLFADEARHAGRTYHLVFGVRYKNTLYYDAEFRELARRFPNFHYIPTLSRENPGWTGARGYVQDHVRPLATSRTDMVAYICGLENMVTANRELLKSLGWDRKHIVFEKYD